MHIFSATTTGHPELEGQAPPRWPVLVAGVASAALAIVIASVKLKWQVGLLGGGILVIMVALARDRRAFFFAVTVASMQVTLHKAFSQILGDNSSGIEALYITTVDFFVALLYVAWFWQGGLIRQLSPLLRHPIAICFYLAIIGEVLSMVNAVEKYRVMWGVARDAWMLLLFWYAAAHLSSRKLNWYAVSGFYFFVVCQGLLVVAQYKTHRPILAQLLAERRSTTLEIKDIFYAQSVSSIFRPSGTAIHPDFLATSLLPMGVIACAIAITHKNRRIQIISAAVFGLCSLAMALTLARAALAGYGVALILALLLIAMRGLASKSRVRGAFFIGAVLLAAASVPIIRKVIADFHQLNQELDARGQLLHLAWKIFLAHPFVGIGTSNFVKVMHDYETTTLIFDGNPVHSLYMLILSESGLVGFATMMALFVIIVIFGFRATHAPDPFLAAIAVALVTAVIGIYVEETITFSLREDEPLEIFWLMVGWIAAIASTVPARRSTATTRETT